MNVTMTEAASEERKSVSGANGASRTQRKRHNGTEEESETGARYFLAKPGTDGDGGRPVLEREVSNENEALVESFRLGLPYYTVQEFRAVSDITGRNPRLKREAVTNGGK